MEAPGRDGPYGDPDRGPAPGQVFKISFSFQRLWNKAPSPYPGPFGHLPRETPLIISTGQKREEMGETAMNIPGMLLCSEHPARIIPRVPGAQQCHPAAASKNRHLKNALKCFSHGKRSPGAARRHVPCFPGQSTLSIQENNIPHSAASLGVGKRSVLAPGHILPQSDGGRGPHPTAETPGQKSAQI